jgi:hypothetical protein
MKVKTILVPLDGSVDAGPPAESARVLREARVPLLLIGPADARENTPFTATPRAAEVLIREPHTVEAAAAAAGETSTR